MRQCGSKSRCRSRFGLLRGFHRRSFVGDQRRRDDAGSEDCGEGVPGDKRAVLGIGTMGRVGQEMIELHLADDVARPVTRLAKIEQLFEADEPAVGVGPAARRPFGVKPPGLGETGIQRPSLVSNSRPASSAPSSRVIVLMSSCAPA